MSINPIPSYHLCPDFSIAPPPDGPLHLGSILKSLDIDGLAPLNENSRIEVPAHMVLPRQGPDIKTGFSCTLNQIRSTEFGIWAKIFGLDGLGGKLGWLRNRDAGETLAIKQLKTVYFNPTDEYMAQALATPNVKAFIDNTRKKVPLYMITGIKVAAGASLSKTKGKTTSTIAKGGVTEPHSQTQIGGQASFTSVDNVGASFEGSTDFVLGYRVRKIFWKHRMRQTSGVAGATLEDDEERSPDGDILTDVEFVNDFTVESDATPSKVFEDERGRAGVEPSVWVMP
ncbi:hypothetical protein TrVGV298_011907 [Trichoderma virens]|nr:hypothetical protein TrVGV298_011907 [Trichoderma virens]